MTLRCEAFLAQVQERGEYSTTHEAEQAARVVLALLGAHIAGHDRAELAARLPETFALVLLNPLQAAQPLDAERFVRATAAWIPGASETTATWDIGAVLSVVADAAGDDLTTRILLQLPRATTSSSAAPTPRKGHPSHDPPRRTPRPHPLPRPLRGRAAGRNRPDRRPDRPRRPTRRRRTPPPRHRTAPRSPHPLTHHIPHTQPLTAPGFVEAVATHLATTTPTARWHTSTALTALTALADLTGPGPTDRLLAALPNGYALLFGRAQLATAA